MQIVVENLRQFGLNEKEIAVYLALISLGPSPVRMIAREAAVNRGTTYDILKALIDQGLASYYKQYSRDAKKQYFVAEAPQKIMDAIENKKRKLEGLKAQFKKTLPELESLYEKSGARPVVKYYEGSVGVETILKDVIGATGGAEEKEYFVYSAAHIRDYLYQAYPDYNADRIKAGIAVKAVAIGEGGELVGLDERKWLSREEKGHPTYILIYSGKLAMITVDATENPVGVIVENEGLYETQKMIFERLWETL